MVDFTNPVRTNNLNDFIGRQVVPLASSRTLRAGGKHVDGIHWLF